MNCICTHIYENETKNKFQSKLGSYFWCDTHDNELSEMKFKVNFYFPYNRHTRTLYISVLISGIERVFKFLENYSPIPTQRLIINLSISISMYTFSNILLLNTLKGKKIECFYS